jgi:hypothetical protein
MQRIVLLMPFVFASACLKVGSSSVRTDDVSAEYRIKALSSGTVEAYASLHRGELTSTTFIEVSGADKLTVSVAGEQKTMTKVELLNVVSYGATFNGQNIDGNEFAFGFNRTVDAGAPRSVCQLPRSFEITQPLGEPTFKRSLDDVVVVYNQANTTDRVRYKLTGSCIQEKEYSVEAGDQGMFTIPKGNFMIKENPNDPCDVTLRVMRYRPGTIDAGFGKGGRIECLQERSVKFRSVP